MGYMRQGRRVIDGARKLTQDIQHCGEVVRNVGWVCCLTIFFYNGRPFQNAWHPNSALVEAGLALPAH